MVVQHNISAMNANRLYGINNSALAKSLEKLSSGYAINRAGDNAAGLAVSEKMRAQIGGLTQASKNAEDGISMVQTFEGALQETDSILQRMRTLAVQSANGSYQDDVDREAMQLEFDQLNDELNQIADTDFNGVVALNGGEMADGLKYTKDDKGNKIFDYKQAKTDRADAAKAAADGLEQAQKNYEKALEDEATKFGEKKDFCDDPDAGNIVDGSHYGKTGADAVWTALGQTATSTDKTQPDELNVTFTFDGSEWKATAVSDKAGNAVEVTEEQLAKITADPQDNGGFKVKADGADTNVNVIFQTYDPGKYDTATVKFTNMVAEKRAPQNAGIAESGYAVGADLENAGFTGPTFQLNTSTFTDDNMNAERKAILDAVKNLEFKGTYANGGKTGVLSMTTTGTDLDVNVGGVKVGALSLSGNKIQYTGVSGSTLGTTAVDVGTIALTDTTNNVVTAGTNNVVEFGVNMDSYAGGDDTGAYKANSVSIAGPNADAQKIWMFNDKPEEPEAAAAAEKKGVSISDNFKNAERNLTYTDNMILQVGARTKDSVEFTFKYSTDGIGDLKANMNCSAREGGLETDKLSLLSQESANEAIDKIDNAINKISMVRGTFGAIQNRLEHKISNIDTNNENLTAAESRIRDTQMDKEMMKFTASQILSQASQSMLAQANSLPQGVLQLLG